MSILKTIINYFKGDGLSREERWLSESSDLVDLERRQKQLIYGTQRGLFDRWVLLLYIIVHFAKQ